MNTFQSKWLAPANASAKSAESASVTSVTPTGTRIRAEIPHTCTQGITLEPITLHSEEEVPADNHAETVSMRTDKSDTSLDALLADEWVNWVDPPRLVPIAIHELTDAEVTALAHSGKPYAVEPTPWSPTADLPVGCLAPGACSRLGVCEHVTACEERVA